MKVYCSSLWGQGHWYQRSQGILILVSSPRGSYFSTETQHHPITFRFQCSKASGQATNKIETQPHTSEDRLPKVILSSQPPQNTHFDMALPNRGTRSLPLGSLHKPQDQPHPPGSRHQDRETTTLQPAERRPQTQKVRQNETTEMCCRRSNKIKTHKNN